MLQLSNSDGVLASLRKFMNRKSSSEYFWKLRNKAKTTKCKLLRYYYSYRYLMLMRRFNASVPLSAKIGEKPFFPHGLNGIFISQEAVIGKNCVIFQQVTIGSNTLKGHSKSGSPVLGDHVYIGAGAKIIGKVKIGANVRIGANAVVVKDIGDNCTVVMSSPRIIVHHEKKDNAFYGVSDSNARIAEIPVNH